VLKTNLIGVRRTLDLRKDFPRAPGKVRVDDQNVVFEDHPGAIGEPADRRVAPTKKQVRGKMGDTLLLAARRDNQQQRGNSDSYGPDHVNQSLTYSIVVAGSTLSV